MSLPKILHDFILVTAAKPETKSAGGLIIPDSAQEQQNRGTVVAMGPKVGLTSLISPEIGDVIEYGQYAFRELPHEGIDYLLIKETDVLFILK